MWQKAHAFTLALYRATEPFPKHEMFALTSQLRYLWGKADLGLDFSGFAPIDLSGIGMTAGVTIRY